MKTIVSFIYLFVLTVIQTAFCQQPSWMPTVNFPIPGALNVYCLGSNYGWCDRIIVGGYSNTGNYPMFHSNDRGNTWENIGPHPIGTAYSLAQEASTLGTKYAAIRDDNNSANNGLFRHHNTYGWQLRCCGGKDVRAVIQNTGTVLCGVRNDGRGIYRSINMGDDFSQIYSVADIYCFCTQQNTFWAGGSYPSGVGVILKSIGFPFDSWTEVGSVDGYVIGITVTTTGNIFAATHQGKIYRSLNGNSFEVCRTGVNWDILKIPIVATTSGTIYYGDWQTGIYCSTDNGNTWNEYNTGLPQPLHIADLAIDPCDGNFLYTAIGGSLSTHVYYREDFLISTSSNPTNGGTTTGDGTYSFNQTATVTATSSSGWNFENWTENGSIVSTDSIYSFNISSNRTLVANFIFVPPPQYLIQTFSNPINGGITTGGGYYTSGTIATVEAFPFSDYEFIDWTENGSAVSTTSSYSFTVTQARNLTANFQWFNSINEEDIQKSVKIFPNPSNGNINISFSLGERKHLIVTLYDLQGKLLFSSIDQMIDPGNLLLMVNLGLFNNGIYIIKITIGNFTDFYKIIKY